MTTQKVVVVGAGIAGLTAAYSLKQEGCTPIVFEKSDVAAEIPGLVSFEVARDGRFLVIRAVSTPPPPQLVVVPNWQLLLEQAGAASAEGGAGPVDREP